VSRTWRLEHALKKQGACSRTNTHKEEYDTTSVKLESPAAKHLRHGGKVSPIGPAKEPQSICETLPNGTPQMCSHGLPGGSRKGVIGHANEKNTKGDQIRAQATPSELSEKRGQKRPIRASDTGNNQDKLKRLHKGRPMRENKRLVIKSQSGGLPAIGRLGRWTERRKKGERVKGETKRKRGGAAREQDGDRLMARGTGR